MKDIEVESQVGRLTGESSRIKNQDFAPAEELTLIQTLCPRSQILKQIDS